MSSAPKSRAKRTEQATPVEPSAPAKAVTPSQAVARSPEPDATDQVLAATETAAAAELSTVGLSDTTLKPPGGLDETVGDRSGDLTDSVAANARVLRYLVQLHRENTTEALRGALGSREHARLSAAVSQLSAFEAELDEQVGKVEGDQ